MESKQVPKASYPFCFLVKNTSEDAQEVNLLDLASNTKDIIVTSAQGEVSYEEIVAQLKQNTYKIGSTMLISYDGRLVERAMPIDKLHIAFCDKDDKGVQTIVRANVTIDPYQQQVDRTLISTQEPYTLGKNSNIKFHLNGWTRMIVRVYPTEKIANEN